MIKEEAMKSVCEWCDDAFCSDTRFESEMCGGCAELVDWTIINTKEVKHGRI